MTAKSRKSPAASTDPDDAPELGDEFFDRATPSVGGKTVSQEQFAHAAKVALRRGRPPGSGTKEPVTLRVDADVLAALKATGPGWQTRVNELLRVAMALRAE